MMADIANGRASVARRPLDDVEHLLRSPSYVVGRELLKLAEPVDRWSHRLRRWAGSRLRRAVRVARRAGGTR